MTIDRTQTQYHDGTDTHLQKVGVATGPASYTTGGDPVTPALLGLSRIDALLFEGFWNGTTLYLARYVASTGSVVIVNPTTGNEIAAATNLSTYTARFLAIGR